MSTPLEPQSNANGSPRGRVRVARVGCGQRRDRVPGRRLAARDPDLGRAARARQPVPRARALEQAAGARVRLRDGARRPQPRQARELRARAHQADRGRSAHRPEQAPVRGHRSARRARPRHRRLQDRQRDRHRAQAGAPLLLRDVLPAAGARADHRVGLRRRDRVPAQGERAAPARRGPAVPDRQLPGRLGADDAGRAGPRRDRPDPAGRLAAVLLGGRRRQEPDALHRAGCSAAPGSASLLGDLGHGKFDGAHIVNNFESLDPANTYWTQALQPLRQGRHGAAALPRSSRSGGAATS